MKAMILFVLALCMISFAKGNKASEAACYEKAQIDFLTFMANLKNETHHYDPSKGEVLMLQRMFVGAQWESIEKAFAKNNGNVCTHLRVMSAKIAQLKKTQHQAELSIVTEDLPDADADNDEADEDALTIE